jgi:hypothetical protein
MEFTYGELQVIGVWQGVDYPKFHQGPYALRFYALRLACGHLLPTWTPHAVRLCSRITQ